MKLRMISLLSILLITAAFFILSCGSKKNVLKLAMWDDVQQSYEQHLIDNFMKANPDIKVTLELTPFDSYFTKCEAAAQGESLSDVLWMDIPDFGRFANSGLLLPIDDRVKAAGIDLSMYERVSIQTYTFDGMLYALPRDIDSMGLWYNKKIFDQAGIPYPNDDWKWSDLEKSGLVIKEKVKGVYPVTFEYYSQNAWQNIINQNGGTILNAEKTKSNWDSPRNIGAIKWMKKLIDIGICPSAEAGDLNVYELFQSDKVAMYYGGAWCALPFSENELVRNHIGVAEMPAGIKDATAAHTISYGIYSHTKNPDAAFRLIQFLTNKESAEYIATTGVSIPNLKSARKYWTEAFSKTFDVSAFIKALNNAVMVAGTRDSKWSIIEEEELKQVWSGKLDPETACKDIAQEVDAAIAAEKK